MRLKLAAILSVFVMALSSIPAARAADEGDDKQPVFLLCPAHERYGSWSLYVKVDKTDPSKVLSLGLEELSQHNSKDDGGYDKVLQAQSNPSTQRVDVATLDAKSFGAGSLRVEKDNALNVTCTPAGDDFALMIDMRISADGHFIMGGSEASKRNIVLKYDKFSKKWNTYATVLQNIKGENAVNGTPLRVTGLAFPVTGTGIYRIVAALVGGRAVMVYDSDR